MTVDENMSDVQMDRDESAEETPRPETGGARTRAGRRMDDMQREMEAMQDRMERRMSGILPDEFVSHMRAAQKEWLLAMRSLLDAGVARIDEKERRRQSRRAQKIDVD